jgi:hypothetical protein
VGVTPSLSAREGVSPCEEKGYPDGSFGVGASEQSDVTRAFKCYDP